MAHDLKLSAQSKEELYKELIPQIKHLIQDEVDSIANLANIAAALKSAFDFFWVGFYLKKESQLVLGPFQGPVACTRINFDKGVCGASFTSKQTIIVPDVDQFPGHIACASASKSEIVVPIFKNDTIIGVLDVDSDHLDHFDQIDEKYLNEICGLLK
jgi:L-methionine (R)-S-oxide reductase